MMTKKRRGRPDGLANITNRPPRWVDGAAIQQEFTVRCKSRITPAHSGQITRACMNMFRGVIEQNKIVHFEWPPKHIEIAPHNDFCGAEILIRTKAKPPGVIIVNSAPALVDRLGRPVKSHVGSPTASGLKNTTGWTRQ